jgi:putative hemolysin
MPTKLGLVCLLLVVACSKSEPVASASTDASAQRVGSCDRGSISGTCSDYGSAYLAQNEGLLTSSCAKLGGTFVYSECPNTSVVGACTLSTGESRKFYGTGASAFDPDRARKECESTFRGSWTAR